MPRELSLAEIWAMPMPDLNQLVEEAQALRAARQLDAQYPNTYLGVYAAETGNFLEYQRGMSL